MYGKANIYNRRREGEMARKAMLIDLKRCSGCGTCVAVCQLQNNQKPGVSWVKLERCEWDDYPNAHRCYLPHACMHCDDAPCVVSCPTGASYKTDDGIVLIKYDVCLGCSDCIEACPYGARTINTNAANYFNASSPAPYESFGVQRINVAEKCTFCYDLLNEGVEPVCVTNCPARARYFGDITDAGSDIAKRASGATGISGNGFYYAVLADMPAGMLVSKVTAPVSPVNPIAPDDVKKAPTTGILIGVGAAVVVAAGVGAGVARNKKNKTSE